MVTQIDRLRNAVWNTATAGVAGVLGILGQVGAQKLREGALLNLAYIPEWGGIVLIALAVASGFVGVYNLFTK